MKQYKINITLLFNLVLIVSAALFITSCNKALPGEEPIKKPVLNPGATQTIGDKISKDANYSIYLAAVNKAPGLLAKMNNPASELTVIAPDNEAFKRSGIPSVEVLNAMPAASVAAIAMYSVIPGRQYLSANIPSSELNLQLPTALKAGDIPGLPVPLQLSIFPSVQNGFYFNNVPIINADQKFTNGVIHNPYALLAPPSQTLRDAIFSRADATYFKAAILRADSSQTGLNSFEYLLSYPVLNMTVLVPDDNAFKAVLFGLVYSSLLEQGFDQGTAATMATGLTSTPDVFKNPALFEALPAATVRGIMAYHFLVKQTPAGYQPLLRGFSNNFPTAATKYKTLVNNSIPTHPGVEVRPTYTGPAVSAITFTGVGSFPPGEPYSSPATATQKDMNAVNGVYYVIDKVLLPQ